MHWPMFTNWCHGFQNTCLIETGLPNFHRMTVAVMKIYSQKLDPKTAYYRDYKGFHDDLFRKDVHSKLGTLPNSCK